MNNWKKKDFNLDHLKDEFDDAHKDFDDLLELEEERNALYHWFDIRGREFIECRIRVCERIQALDRKSSRTPSEKSSFSRKSKSSDKSKLSSSSTKHLSLALIDAAAKSAKLHAEMEFLEKERELGRLQLEKELAVANAEECAIKRILEEEKMSAGDSITSVGIEPRSKGHRGQKFFSLPRVVPCFPLLGLTPCGLFMGLSSTLIYTSELILCFTIPTVRQTNRQADEQMDR